MHMHTTVDYQECILGLAFGCYRGRLFVGDGAQCTLKI